MITNDTLPNNSNETYFAAKAGNETANILLDKAKSFYNFMEANAYMVKLRNMWRAYHGAYGDYMGYGHRTEFTGEQGELVMLPVNHFRNLAQHMLNMVTASRPTMDARAVNTDYKSLAQTYLANGILDYYMREKHLEDAFKKAVEYAIVLGAGFIKMEWNATAGEMYDYDEESGQPNYEGEIEFSTYTPLDVVMDGTKENWNHDWIMVRSFQNRFNLIAKYPELADKIKGVPSKTDSTIMRLAVFSNDGTDDIPVYEFYHKKTEALPNGRYLLFLDNDIVLLDTDLPYRVVPVFRIAPSDILGTPYGYTPMFDIFPIQECINSLYSTIMTNQNAFGVQNLFIPNGADIAVSTLEGGMNIIKGNVKPEAINLTETPKEVFEFLQMLISSAETISGVNSVARGNPESSLRSGNALALVQSMALQFISGLQQSYVKMIEDTGTALIQILKDFADTPKIVTLVGKNNRTLLKEFTGEDLSAINRVIVDMGNPLARCLKKNTPILMFDGTIKMVQDIQVNDLIMGPDSKQRTVTNTNSDKEMMYDVTSVDKNQNVYYGCNESHILSLKYCANDGRHGLKQYEKVDISVKEYLSLPERHRRLFMGYKSGVDFSKKETSIPPYILGTWLGDGHSATTALTSMDQELINSWTEYATSLELKIRVVEQEDNKSKIYHITSGLAHGPSDRNKMMNNLRDMNLINNKHIPFNYLTSSREDRLALLAGFIDTDGTRIDETFTITQKSNQLTDDLIFLSRSLGFRTTVRKVPSDSGPSKDGSPRTIVGECNKISIGGNTWEIPTKLPRKKSYPKEKARDWMNYGIEVTAVGEDTFYGFTLQEEPHFLLGDFTVTHNTTAGRVQMAEQMLQMKILQTPQQYFEVLNTGRLDVTFEGEMSELLLIKRENEKLMEGAQVQALSVDEHRTHIMEHKAVIADPDLRFNPEIVKNTLDHIQEHINLLQTTNPDLLQIIGEQPLKPPAPPAPPMQMTPPGAPIPPGGPQGNPGMPSSPFPSMLPQAPPQGIPQPQHTGHPKVANPNTQHPKGHPGIPSAHSVKQSSVAALTANPTGMIAPGQTQINSEQGRMLVPGLPKVNANLLPNPELQENALNNVKIPRHHK